MFDVGFSELALIFGVSLVVLGPKRLPGLVNKVGRWVGKARVMANDFRRQLENEVNLEELNRMTELQSKQSSDALPTPPPGLNGEPAPDMPTYPYSAAPAAAADTDSPAVAAPTDDTYSHAHAEGDAPMPWAPDLAAEPAETHSDTPQQAALDLSVPEDDSHLPPDDARRYS